MFNMFRKPTLPKRLIQVKELLCKKWQKIQSSRSIKQEILHVSGCNTNICWRSYFVRQLKTFRGNAVMNCLLSLGSLKKNGKEIVVASFPI